jgi:glycosyltransferase involved in cell wall biosynthesis
MVISPLVSIICLTYNHEDFIQESIDSFLCQETNFQFEIIIHDDASTDGTTQIIAKYQRDQPNKFNVFFRERNQYSLFGFSFLENLIEVAKGKYIAFCDGDDFWLDSRKLQKQIEFLEANSEFSVCFHEVKILENEKLKENTLTKVPSPVTTILDLAKLGNYIHSPSCVFRNQGTKIIGPHLCESPAADYYLHVMNAQYGNIFFFNEPMAVYRIHKTSCWSSQTYVDQLRKFQRTRAAIIKDLLPASYEARSLLARAYISEAVKLYYDFDEKRIVEDVDKEAAIFSNYLAEALFQKLDELKLSEEIAQRTLFRHLIDALKKRLNRKV